MNALERNLSYGIYTAMHAHLRHNPGWTAAEAEALMLTLTRPAEADSLTWDRYVAIVAANREIIEIELDLARQRVA